MEFNLGEYKSLIGNGKLPKKTSIIETTVKEVTIKFNRLNQLIEQLNQEESDIREQIRRNGSDLRDEVDKMELKHRKLLDAVKSLC